MEGKLFHYHMFSFQKALNVAMCGNESRDEHSHSLRQTTPTDFHLFIIYIYVFHIYNK